MIDELIEKLGLDAEFVDRFLAENIVINTVDNPADVRRQG